jgi:hypothetical protein
MPKTNNEPKMNRPVHEVRIGLIKAAVWANTVDDGVRQNVTFERSYRDGEEWKTTGSFGRDDLLVVAKLADQAHSWLVQLRATKQSAGSGKADLRQGKLPPADE